MKTNKCVLKAIFLFTAGAILSISSIHAEIQSMKFPRERIISRLERMNEIGKNTGQVVTYNKTAIKNDEQLPEFTAHTNNMEEWLYESLKNTRWMYRKIRDNYFSVLEKEAAALASSVVETPAQKEGTLSGKIVDESGEVLPGATVKVSDQTIGTASDINGNFRLSLPAGTYTIEIGYIGYQTQRVTGVKINEGKNTPLDVSLNTESTELGEVVVTATYNKASTNGMLKLQQTKAEVSSVISSQQISTLPDKNVGEVLKRISGVSTVNNSKVIVRGIAERYNVAQLDGVTLPSTDVQTRDFEFDIIPNDLIDNVVVSKSYTPDLSFGFGGGLVQINTISVPDENFIKMSVGGKFSPHYTGKRFMGYGRGKWDYLGMDDGVRDHFPEGLFPVMNTMFLLDFETENFTPLTVEQVREQNKKIGGLERLGTRKYKTMPGQNYNFSIGRSYDLGRTKMSRLGFVGALTYRNEQSIEDILHYERGPFDKMGTNLYDFETEKQYYENNAKNYKFNTTWAVLLNGGWQTENHSIFTKNMYSRMFNNTFYRIVGTGEDMSVEMYGKIYPVIREFDSPKFLDLLQNKLEGEHRFLKNFTFTWAAARGKVLNNELDAVEAYLVPIKFTNLPGLNSWDDKPVFKFNDDDMFYKYVLAGFHTGEAQSYVPWLKRSQYFYDETNWSAEASLSYEFKMLNKSQRIKAGIQSLERHGKFKWSQLPIGRKGFNNKYDNLPIWAIDLDMKEPKEDVFYFPQLWDLQRYEGKNTNIAYFGMMDNRLTNWFRLVWGLRVESYEYDGIYSEGSNSYTYVDPEKQKNMPKSYFVNPETGRVVSERTDVEADEVKWHYLPSAALTLTPLKNLNIRGSYAKSVVRPGLIENSKFTRFNPEWGTYQINEGVLSTKITHYDAKIEWFPTPGEVLSVGYFKKDFDNPVELYRGIFDTSQKTKVLTQNSKSAKVTGWEFDARKNLSFLYPGFQPLSNIYIYGNLTLQKSEVQARFFEKEYIGSDHNGNGYSIRIEKLLKMKRPLYGQVPILYNFGIQYQDERLGINLAFNHMGNKTFATSGDPRLVEFERERDQMDAQISYNFLRNKDLKLKLNISNILNTPYHFFTNGGYTYKIRDDYDSKTDYWEDSYEWIYGFDENYQWGYFEKQGEGDNVVKIRKGDDDTYKKKTGTAFSLSLSYSF